MPVVKLDMKTVKVFGAFGSDALDQLERADALALCLEHNRRTMGVISTHKMYRMAAHAHRAHPDIRLDIFHDVANMKRAVGIRSEEHTSELQSRGHLVCRLLHENNKA